MAHASTAPMVPGPRLKAAQPLTTVVYRSRAVTPLAPPELDGLVRTSQARNRRDGITGVMLYDDSRFFQWLEGPPGGVDRLMRSIERDPRHTDVEILSQRSRSGRCFADWDMKLALRGAAGDPAWNRDALEPPRDVIDALHRHPERAPVALIRLVPLGDDQMQAADPLVASLSGVKLRAKTAAALRTVLLKTVLPSLPVARPLPATRLVPARVDPRVAELADLLVSTDDAAALELIRQLRGEDGDLRQLYAPLFEPAARDLGDFWSDDTCSEFDVTLGLCRLQTAIRLLGADSPRALPHGHQPNVLVAPVPGELHHLVAAMDADWLWHAGWTPQYEFPTDDRALAELVAGDWVDVLDLSLSAAFRREDSLPRLRRTITTARRASRNPGLIVVVGGRAFVEGETLGGDVGADFASRSSRNVDRLMLQGIARDAPARNLPVRPARTTRSRR